MQSHQNPFASDLPRLQYGLLGIKSEEAKARDAQWPAFLCGFFAQAKSTSPALLHTTFGIFKPFRHFTKQPSSSTVVAIQLKRSKAYPFHQCVTTYVGHTIHTKIFCDLHNYMGAFYQAKILYKHHFVLLSIFFWSSDEIGMYFTLTVSVNSHAYMEKFRNITCYTLMCKIQYPWAMSLTLSALY